MRRHLIPLFTLLGVLSFGSARAQGENWDFNQEIEHKDDGVAGHECATDFHMEFTVNANGAITEATATGGDPEQTRQGVVTYQQVGNSWRAKVDWTFDPCIDRGEKVTYKIKAGGKKLPPDEAYWTYAIGRGGSILMAGPEYDSGLGDPRIWCSPTSPAPLQGQVELAVVATPYHINALVHGTIPGLGAPQPLNLLPGGSMAFAAPAVPPGSALVVQVTGQGAPGDSLLAVYQYSCTAPVPGLEPAALIALTLLLVAGGAIVLLRRRTGGAGAGIA